MSETIINIIVNVSFFVGGCLFIHHINKEEMRQQDLKLMEYVHYNAVLYKENQQLHEVARYGGKTKEEAMQR